MSDNPTVEDLSNVWKSVAELIDGTSDPKTSRMEEVILSLASGNSNFVPSESSMKQFNFPKEVLEQERKLEEKKRKEEEERKKRDQELEKRRKEEEEEAKRRHEEELKLREEKKRQEEELKKQKELEEAQRKEEEERLQLEQEEVNRIQESEATLDTSVVNEEEKQDDDFFANFGNNDSSDNSSVNWNTGDDSNSFSGFDANFNDFTSSEQSSNSFDDFGDFSSTPMDSNSFEADFGMDNGTSNSFNFGEDDDFQYGGPSMDEEDDEYSYGSYGGSSYGAGGYNQLDLDDPEDFLEWLEDEENHEKGTQKLLQMIQDGNEEILVYVSSNSDRNSLIIKLLSDSTNNESGQSPLHLAAFSGSMNWFSIAMEANSTEIPDKEQNTALHIAAALGRTDILKALVTAGFSVSATNDSSRTPLHLACVNGHYDSVEFLVDNGSEITKFDKDGLSALHLACLRSSDDIVPYLLSKTDKSIISKGDYKGRTPLHSAAHSANIKLCKLLISKGANVNETDFDGKNAILWCLTQPVSTLSTNDIQYQSCLEYLVKQGVLLGVADRKKRNCLHYASYYSIESCVEYILAHSKSLLNQPDAKNQTPLFSAVASQSDDIKSERIVSMLLEAGADSYQCTKKGKKYPIHIAIYSGKHETATLLYDKMKESNEIENVFDTQRKSLLQYCAENNVNSLAESILSKNRDLINHCDRLGNTILHSIAQGETSVLLTRIMTILNREEMLNLIQKTNRQKRNVFHVITGFDNITMLLDLIQFMDDDNLVEELMLMKDYAGYTAPHYAALRGSFYCLDHFVSSTPKLLQSLSENGQTLLHTAIAGSSPIRCIALLIENGLDVNATDEEERTPLFYTLRTKNSRLDIIRLLIERYSVDVNKTDDSGQSFIARASQSEDCHKIMEIVDEFDK